MIRTLLNAKKSPSANKSLLALLLSLSCISFYGQNTEKSIQDVLEQFKTTQNPNEGIKNLLAVEDHLAQVSDSLQGYYYTDLGIAYGQLNKADSSFYYLDKAEKIAKNINSEFLLATVNNTRGLVYMGNAEYESSLAAYQEVMKLTEGKNDKRLKDVLGKAYGNLGGIYFQMGEPDKALETTKKSLALSESINNNGEIARNHLRLALVYNRMDQVDDGIYHLNQARDYYNDLNDIAMLVYVENNLGNIFRKKGELDNAFDHFNKAYKMSKSLGEQEEYVLTLMSMSNIRLEQLELQKAEAFAHEALEFSKDNGYINTEKQTYDLLYKIALRGNRTKDALNYRNAFIVISDSLKSVEVKTNVANLETKYETAKKEKEIQKLTFDSELKDANLAQSRNAQIALGTGALGIIAILIVFFSARHKKEKVEREAQALQVEALQKRFMELHSSPAELAVELDGDELNKKLHTALTDREFEVLKLCVTGKTNSVIAKELFVSISTVKFHLRNAYSKLGVNNRKEAFEFMLKSV